MASEVQMQAGLGSVLNYRLTVIGLWAVHKSNPEVTQESSLQPLIDHGALGSFNRITGTRPVIRKPLTLLLTQYTPSLTL